MLRMENCSTGLSCYSTFPPFLRAVKVQKCILYTYQEFVCKYSAQHQTNLLLLYTSLFAIKIRANYRMEFFFFRKANTCLQAPIHSCNLPSQFRT